jgi:hypothetical protein
VEDVKLIMKKKEDQIKRLLGVLLRLMVDLETVAGYYLHSHSQLKVVKSTSGKLWKHKKVETIY